jgi:hypothetical protein
MGHTTGRQQKRPRRKDQPPQNQGPRLAVHPAICAPEDLCGYLGVVLCSAHSTQVAQWRPSCPSQNCAFFTTLWVVGAAGEKKKNPGARGQVPCFLHSRGDLGWANAALRLWQQRFS